MSFNSYVFILLFLPVALAGYYRLNGVVRESGAVWLVFVSFFYYGLWNCYYPVLLFLSASVTYWFGGRIHSHRQAGRDSGRRVWLAVGVLLNLGVLGYFKYANFLLDGVSILSGVEWEKRVLMPLAVSYFTFQQVAWLVDISRGELDRKSFLGYLWFVSFFPKLLAGPILYGREMQPQIEDAPSRRLDYGDLAVGLTIFTAGLFKKVVIADSLTRYVDPLFAATQKGLAVSFFESWGGVFAYSFLLYFDFSGYSDMAIGLGRMFGFRLPENFNSPYKSRSIIEFWRRWHMTLSLFLKRYLYIAMGGNRRGENRKYFNILVTMLLAGLWHGAGLTYLAWGGLHGLYLVCNHLWRRLRSRIPWAGVGWGGGFGQVLAGGLTFLAVSFAWAFFRADSLETAWRLSQSLLGVHGFALPVDFLAKSDKFLGLGNLIGLAGLEFSSSSGLLERTQIVLLLVLALVVALAPNVQEIMAFFRPCLGFGGDRQPSSGPQWYHWRPSDIFMVLTLLLFLAAFFNLNRVRAFIYFQF